MKYKRNSGRKRPVNGLSVFEQNSVARQLAEDAQWIIELEEIEQYSLQWVHKVAIELLFQCMGKKEVVGSYKGKDQIIRVFKEKAAIDVLAMIAKMNGHLFDVVKGTIKQSGKIDHEHRHQIEMKPDANRTVEVFEILEACGALKPPVKQLSNSEVVEIHSA